MIYHYKRFLYQFQLLFSKKQRKIFLSVYIILINGKKSGDRAAYHKGLPVNHRIISYISFSNNSVGMAAAPNCVKR